MVNEGEKDNMLKEKISLGKYTCIVDVHMVKSVWITPCGKQRFQMKVYGTTPAMKIVNNTAGKLC